MRPSTGGTLAGALLYALALAAAACAAAVDELLRARCTATCYLLHGSTKNNCESECSLTRVKPGRCPSGRGEERLGVFERACLRACAADTDCPGTDKCCVHACGATCQRALDLHTYPGLPPVPTNLTVVDSRKHGRSKVVQWTAGGSGADGDHVWYVLQVRRQSAAEGPRPQEQRYEPWRTRMRRRRGRLEITGLTPAHWYQVRVAAVNPNGSRGYSQPSQPFKLNIEPGRAKEPYNLTVVRPGWVEGRLWAELRWKRPHSDLPIKHYKVFWSHCIRTDANPCKPTSVIVKHKTISASKTSFILKDLEPQSLNFIQVQALTATYESKRFNSEKAATFIDTNKLKNATYKWLMQPKNPVRNVTVINFYRAPETPDKLEGLLVWNSAPGRFHVSWAPKACPSAVNNPIQEAITQDFKYEMDNLAFNCKYQVVVTSLSSNKSARITFRTPHCTEVIGNTDLPCL